MIAKSVAVVCTWWALASGSHAWGSFDQNDSVSGGNGVTRGGSSSSRVELSRGFSLNVALEYSTRHPGKGAESMARARSETRDDQPPGADSDPDGVTVYNSVGQVPSARLLWHAQKLQLCYATRSGRSHCWAPYVCGHRCEPVLMAVNSFCRRPVSRGCEQTMSTTETDEEEAECRRRRGWIRCRKPRKYMRCYARVCFRRHGEGPQSGSPRPVSYEDPSSIAIVRYRRPRPKLRYDFFASKRGPSEF